LGRGAAERPRKGSGQSGRNDGEMDAETQV
jgi:hypothetical protein